MRMHREQEAAKDEEAALRLERIRELEQAMAQKDQEANKHKEAHDFLAQLVQDGELEVDGNGNIIPPSSKMKV